MANTRYKEALAILSKEKIKNGRQHLDKIIAALKNPHRDPQTEGLFKKWDLKAIEAKKREAQVAAMWGNFKSIYNGAKKKAVSSFPYTPWKLLSDSEKQKKVDAVLVCLFGKTHQKAAWALLASLDEPDAAWAKKKARKVKRNKKPLQIFADQTTPEPVKPDKARPPLKAPGRIGNIGKTVLFCTSSKKILTFSKMDHTIKGRWASRPRFKKKPRRQFLGPDAETISFTVELNALHGVKPRKTAKNIEKLVRTGKPQTVVIGGKKIGRYVITEMSEAWERVLNKGEVAKITCNLTLEEYL